MKIALIAPTALPSRRANAIQTIRMAHAFARLGHEVLLVAYAPHPQTLTPDPSPTRGEGSEPSPPAPLPQGERGGSPSPPTPLPQRERGGSPSPPTPLPQGERGGSPSPPTPLPQRERGGSPSPPTPLPQGERGGSPSPPAPLPQGERGGSPSPPASLPQGERGEEPLTPGASPRRGEGRVEDEGAEIGWLALAAEYGLESQFKVCWLKAQPWARRYDFALRAMWQAHCWGAACIFTRLPQAAALGSLLGKTTLFEAHDLPRGGAAHLFRLFLLGSGAKRLVAISRALADDLQKSFPELSQREAGFLCLAPDGVDLSQYTPLLSPAEARRKLHAWGWELPQGFIAGYTGHLYRGRGAELIVALTSSLPEVHFLIVGGEAEQRQWLEGHLRAHGATNYTLTGLVAPSQVALFQMASDVLLMPYQEKVEASSGGDIARYLSPLKLFEYLASGRPILASDLPVLMEVLNAENAILLPKQEIEAWENALRRLMQNPQERQKLAEAARQTAEQYSWESRAARILAD